MYSSSIISTPSPAKASTLGIGLRDLQFGSMKGPQGQIFIPPNLSHENEEEKNNNTDNNNVRPSSSYGRSDVGNVIIHPDISTPRFLKSGSSHDVHDDADLQDIDFDDDALHNYNNNNNGSGNSNSGNGSGINGNSNKATASPILSYEARTGKQQLSNIYQQHHNTQLQQQQQQMLSSSSSNHNVRSPMKTTTLGSSPVRSAPPQHSLYLQTQLSSSSSTLNSAQSLHTNTHHNNNNNNNNNNHSNNSPSISASSPADGLLSITVDVKEDTTIPPNNKSKFQSFDELKKEAASQIKKLKIFTIINIVIYIVAFSLCISSAVSPAPDIYPQLVYWSIAINILCAILLPYVYMVNERYKLKEMKICIVAMTLCIIADILIAIFSAKPLGDVESDSRAYYTAHYANSNITFSDFCDDVKQQLNKICSICFIVAFSMGLHTLYFIHVYNRYKAKQKLILLQIESKKESVVKHEKRAKEVELYKLKMQNDPELQQQMLDERIDRKMTGASSKHKRVNKKSEKYAVENDMKKIQAQAQEEFEQEQQKQNKVIAMNNGKSKKSKKSKEKETKEQKAARREKKRAAKKAALEEKKTNEQNNDFNNPNIILNMNDQDDDDSDSEQERENQRNL